MVHRRVCGADCLRMGGSWAIIERAVDTIAAQSPTSPASSKLYAFCRVAACSGERVSVSPGEGDRVEMLDPMESFQNRRKHASRPPPQQTSQTPYDYRAGFRRRNRPPNGANPIRILGFSRISRPGGGLEWTYRNHRPCSSVVSTCEEPNRLAKRDPSHPRVKDIPRNVSPVEAVYPIPRNVQLGIL